MIFLNQIIFQKIINQQSLQTIQMSFADHGFQHYSSSKKRRTTIPSLLFVQNNYRSSMGFDLKRGNQRLSSRSMNLYKCENHPSKAANFIGVLEDQQLYYCEKCAILLASQGFSVQKIQYTNNQQNESRQKQIKQFLSRINAFSLEVDDKKTQARENLINSQQFYGQQIEEINQYFAFLYQSLELEKNKCYNYILNQRTKVEQKTRDLAKDLQNLRQQLDQIKEDIQENIQAVFQIEQQSYRPVIIQYQEKLNEFQNKFRLYQIQPIQLQKIQFAGLPQQINSISQIFLRKSGGILSLQQQAQNKQNVKIAENSSLKVSFQGHQNLKTNKSDETIKQYFKIWQL